MQNTKNELLSEKKLLKCEDVKIVYCVSLLSGVQLFWSVAVLVATAGLVFQLYSILYAFFQYKTSSYFYEVIDGYYFPDVTICNLNGISSTNLRKAAQNNYIAATYLSLSLRENTTGQPDTATFFYALGEQHVEVGHSLQDFIIRCRFEEQDCNITEDFVLYEFFSFFNCYTFIKGRQGEKTHTQSARAGFSVTLYLEPLDPNISKVYDESDIAGNTNGVRVLLTPPNSLPAIGVMGHNILVGHSSYMGFDLRENVRLPDPYTSCRGVNSMQLGGDLTYSFVECKNICIHNYVIDKCGCFPTFYRVRKNYTAMGIPSCGIGSFDKSDQEKYKSRMACQDALLDQMETLLDFALDCNCYNPCEETVYPLVISQSEFPSPNALKSFWKVVLEEHPMNSELKAYTHYQHLLAQNTSFETLKEWTHKHFLRLNVFANSKNILVQEQVPQYSESDLLSLIGGCLGLWLGMSIISIAEFFNLGFQLISFSSRLEYPTKEKKSSPYVPEKSTKAPIDSIDQSMYSPSWN